MSVHGGFEETELLVVEKQLMRRGAWVLTPAGDDERRVPGRPVVVWLAALRLVGSVRALRDAEEGS